MDVAQQPNAAAHYTPPKGAQAMFDARQNRGKLTAPGGHLSRQRKARNAALAMSVAKIATQNPAATSTTK